MTDELPTCHPCSVPQRRRYGTGEIIACPQCGCEYGPGYYFNRGPVCSAVDRRAFARTLRPAARHRRRRA